MSTLLYRGAPIGGAYTGGDVQALVAEATGNAKTGPALTLWILPATDNGEKPLDVLNRDGWRSTCGDCPHQATSCYTSPGASQTLSAGAASIVRGISCGPVKVSRKVRRARSAAFGDIAALPLHVVDAWRDLRASHGLAPLGYTHGWRTRPDLRVDHMASVETEDGAREARAAGWRYFRVRPVGAPLLAGEVQCPATDTAKRANPIDCNRCGLCDGLTRGAHRPSVSIEDHGPQARRTARRVSSLSIAS